MLKKDREEQRREREREREQKIKESRYRWYGRVNVEGIPEYLKKGWRESSWRRVMRFRLGNKRRRSLYWVEEEKRLYRVCGAEKETWEHVCERCGEWKAGEKSWQNMVAELLGEAGEREWWMRELEKVREESEERKLKRDGDVEVEEEEADGERECE